MGEETVKAGQIVEAFREHSRRCHLYPRLTYRQLNDLKAQENDNLDAYIRGEVDKEIFLRRERGLLFTPGRQERMFPVETIGEMCIILRGEGEPESIIAKTREHETKHVNDIFDFKPSESGVMKPEILFCLTVLSDRNALTLPHIIHGRSLPGQSLFASYQKDPLRLYREWEARTFKELKDYLIRCTTPSGRSPGDNASLGFRS